MLADGSQGRARDRRGPAADGPSAAAAALLAAAAVAAPRGGRGRVCSSCCSEQRPPLRRHPPRVRDGVGPQGPPRAPADVELMRAPQEAAPLPAAEHKDAAAAGWPLRRGGAEVGARPGVSTGEQRRRRRGGGRERGRPDRKVERIEDEEDEGDRLDGHGGAVATAAPVAPIAWDSLKTSLLLLLLTLLLLPLLLHRRPRRPNLVPAARYRVEDVDVLEDRRADAADDDERVCSQSGGGVAPAGGRRGAGGAQEVVEDWARGSQRGARGRWRKRKRKRKRGRGGAAGPGLAAAASSDSSSRRLTQRRSSCRRKRASPSLASSCSFSSSSSAWPRLSVLPGGKHGLHRWPRGLRGRIALDASPGRRTCGCRGPRRTEPSLEPEPGPCLDPSRERGCLSTEAWRLLLSTRPWMPVCDLVGKRGGGSGAREGKERGGLSRRRKKNGESNKHATFSPQIEADVGAPASSPCASSPRPSPTAERIASHLLGTDPSLFRTGKWDSDGGRGAA